MTSDYFLNPLQGALFWLYHNTLMGITFEQVDQYKLEYAAAKAAKAKMTSDCLSV